MSPSIITGMFFISTQAQQADHPSMSCSTLFTSLANWTFQNQHEFYKTQMMDCHFRLHNRTVPQPCTLTLGHATPYCGSDHMILSAKDPLYAPQPGNYIAFYKGEVCIGGAKIIKLGPSEFAMNYQTYKQNNNHEKNDVKKKGINKYLDKFLR